MYKFRCWNWNRFYCSANVRWIWMLRGCGQCHVILLYGEWISPPAFFWLLHEPHEGSQGNARTRSIFHSFAQKQEKWFYLLIQNFHFNAFAISQTLSKGVGRWREGEWGEGANNVVGRFQCYNFWCENSVNKSRRTEIMHKTKSIQQIFIQYYCWRRYGHEWPPVPWISVLFTRTRCLPHNNGSVHCWIQVPLHFNVIICKLLWN